MVRSKSLDRIIDLRHEPVVRQSETPASLDPHRIAFITSVADEQQYRICLQYLKALEIPPGFAVERIAVFGGSSMAEKYQRAMKASAARYKIYLHVDTYVVHRGLVNELLDLFGRYPRLGLVGTVGATLWPATGLCGVDNVAHCYGSYWEYLCRADSMPGIPLWPPHYFRRKSLISIQSFVGDYLPAVVVDGFFMATQYDIPWKNPFGGLDSRNQSFDVVNDLYDHVQSFEFIKAGLDVGIAQQTRAVWCYHYGPLQKRTRAKVREHAWQRNQDLLRKAEVLRQLYPSFVGVPAARLYQQRPASSDRDSHPQRLGVGEET